MPGDHKELYVSTTLAIVIVTTFVLGGLTEPILTGMDMKKKSDHGHPHYGSHQGDYKHSQSSGSSDNDRTSVKGGESKGEGQMHIRREKSTSSSGELPLAKDSDGEGGLGRLGLGRSHEVAPRDGSCSYFVLRASRSRRDHKLLFTF